MRLAHPTHRLTEDSPAPIDLVRIKRPLPPKESNFCAFCVHRWGVQNRRPEWNNGFSVYSLLYRYPHCILLLVKYFTSTTHITADSICNSCPYAPNFLSTSGIICLTYAFQAGACVARVSFKSEMIIVDSC